MHLTQALQTAIDAVTDAGRYTLSQLHRRGEAVERFAHDVKLQLDHDCQERITSAVRSAYPDIGVFGEEGETPGADPRLRWVVDPIDGTVNFTRGLPMWGHSLALERDGKTCLGVFYMPELDRLFTASDEHEPVCNGEPIRAADTARLADAITLTGIPKTEDPADRPFRLFSALTRGSLKSRVMGSAAADMCMVACGCADVYMESCIYLWDIAAAGYIAERAGARAAVYEAYDGGRLRYLCAAPGVFEEAYRLLDECFG